jgi:hypothetical protein
MRQVKLKNYIFLAIIFILTISAVLIVKNFYENKKDIQTNDRLNNLYEIKEDDLKNYVVENNEIVIYTSKSSDSSIEEFEVSFEEYITSKELSKEIIYLNLDQVSSKFYDDLKNNFFNDSLKNKNIPKNQANIYILENGKIKAMLYEDSTDISLSDVDKFLKDNMVIYD